MARAAVVAVPVVQSKVPLEKPTEESLLAEAAALGDGFSEVTAHPADLVADGEELLQTRDDASELAKRGYKVSAGQFTRVELLVGMIKPLIAQQGRQVELSKVKTAQAEEARLRLIAIRGELARIANAAGIPSELFSLETNNTQRLNVVMMKMEEVLENVRACYEELPDQKRVDALTKEAATLIAAQKQSRSEARMVRGDRRIDGRTQGQLERLLLNVMQHLSNQGLAAFPDDASREPLYRLDHVYGRRPTRGADSTGGGTIPTPDPVPPPPAN